MLRDVDKHLNFLYQRSYAPTEVPPRDEYDSWKYPIEKFNKKYIELFPTQYNDYRCMYGITEAIEYALAFKTVSKGHVRNLDRLAELDHNFIYDIAAQLYGDKKWFNNDLFLSCIVSPTLGISIFDVRFSDRKDVEGSNETWFSEMIKMHNLIDATLHGKGDFQIGRMQRLYDHYHDNFDTMYTSTLYDPMKSCFLAVAAMDVIHISTSNHTMIKGGHFTPSYVFNYNSYEFILDYMKRHSLLFSLTIIENRSTFMSVDFYNQMLVDLKDYTHINVQLYTQMKLSNIVEKRIDDMQIYEDTCVRVTKKYIEVLKRICTSSPFIINKKECHTEIEFIAECMEKSNTHESEKKQGDYTWKINTEPRKVGCFLMFKRLIDKLIHSNKLETGNVTTFRHYFYGELFYCPFPPLIEPSTLLLSPGDGVSN